MSNSNSSNSRRDALKGLMLLAGGAAVPQMGLRTAQAETLAPSVKKYTLTAQTTEGPYYFDPKLERADIRENRTGVPINIVFMVMTEDGTPFANARVDIWHCDAQGFYSGYANQGDDQKTSMKGQTFLRGYVHTNAQGRAEFQSIYPGWYRGRTTHIHFKVWNGAQCVLTSQFFLPDALSEYLYDNLSQYKRQSLRDTLNSTDGIMLEAGNTVHGYIREEVSTYIATLNVVIDPNAKPVIDRPPAPGDGAPPPMPPNASGKRPDRAPPPFAKTLEGEARVKAIVPPHQ